MMPASLASSGRREGVRIIRVENDGVEPSWIRVRMSSSCRGIDVAMDELIADDLA